MALSKKLAAEFIGTAVLVIVAVGVATENFGFKLFGGSVAAGVVTTALAFGLVLMGLAYPSARFRALTSTRRSRSDS
jgi:aquaporin Z